MIVGGLLAVVAALCLICFNLLQESRAANAAMDALSEIRAATDSADTRPTDETDALSSDTGMSVPPIPADTAEAVDLPETEAETELTFDPTADMPIKEIQNQAYIGVLDIPILELSVPIISEWSYARLKIAPCRYSGSVYADDMILLGHNYRRQFGALTKICVGDAVTFTDMDGNRFDYKVVMLEILDGDDVESMTSGTWDLTLFTCTVSGQTRITVRCERLG